MLSNRLERIDAWWAILKTGAVFGPINPSFTGPEAAYVVGRSRAMAIVTDSRGVETLADERDAPELQRVRHMISVDGDDELTLDSHARRDGQLPRGPSGGRRRPADPAASLVIVHAEAGPRTGR